jgi:hypothetical protein
MIGDELTTDERLALDRILKAVDELLPFTTLSPTGRVDPSGYTRRPRVQLNLRHEYQEFRPGQLPDFDVLEELAKSTGVIQQSFSVPVQRGSLGRYTIELGRENDLDNAVHFRLDLDAFDDEDRTAIADLLAHGCSPTDALRTRERANHAGLTFIAEVVNEALGAHQLEATTIASSGYDTAFLNGLGVLLVGYREEGRGEHSQDTMDADTRLLDGVAESTGAFTFVDAIPGDDVPFDLPDDGIFMLCDTTGKSAVVDALAGVPPYS